MQFRCYCAIVENMTDMDMARPKISDVQVSLRLPDATVERAEKLADKMSSVDLYRSFHPSGVSTSVVYRLALQRGIASLEEELNEKKKGR